MMTAEFMLSKRPVLRFTAALLFLLNLCFLFSRKMFMDLCAGNLKPYCTHPTKTGELPVLFTFFPS